MATFLLFLLLACFAVPAVLERRARRRACSPYLLPAVDAPPHASRVPMPRGRSRRRYVDAGLTEVDTWLREQADAA